MRDTFHPLLIINLVDIIEAGNWVLLMAAFIVQRKSLAFGYPEAAGSSPDCTWNLGTTGDVADDEDNGQDSE
jgi:hypothetical protein